MEEGGGSGGGDGGPPSEDGIEQANRGLAELSKGIGQVAGAHRLLHEGVGSMGSHIDSLEKELAAKPTDSVSKEEHTRALRRIASVTNHVMELEAGIAQLMEDLSPLLGRDSPVANKIQDGLGLLEGARSIIGSIEGMEGAKTAVDHFDRSRFPEIDNDTLKALPELGGWTLEMVMAGVKHTFRKEGAEGVGRKIEAIIHAFRVLKSNQNIRGAAMTLDRALSSAQHRNLPDFEVRGHVYEIIRLAHLIESGRKLDSISIHVPSFHYDGLWINYSTGRVIKKLMRSETEIDAKEDDIAIEIKTIWLGDALGENLSRLLDNLEGPDDIDMGEPIRDTGKFVFNSAKKAVALANQFIRYRELIRLGKFSRFELHITCTNPVPEKVLRSIHRLFGKDSVEVIWYEKIHEAEGITLTPKAMRKAEAVPARAQPEKPVASPIPSSLPDAKKVVAVETSPENGAEGDDEVIVIETGAEEESIGEMPEAPGLIVEVEGDGFDGMDDETLEAELAHLDAVSAAQQAIFASPNFMAAIEYNTSDLDDFIEWIVRAGHWAGTLVSMDPEEILGAATTLHSSWAAERTAEARREAALDTPWDAIEDKSAQSAFNTILKNQEPTRTIAIDWRHRVAQSIFNEHVTGALAEIHDYKTVKENRTLSDSVGEFVEYLRGRYGPRSYFKITEDGPKLIAIMKQYLWLRSGG